MLRQPRRIWVPLVVLLALAVFAAPVQAASTVSVSIQSPSSGATVFGTVNVSGTASSKFGIGSVSVSVDSGTFQPAALSGSTWTYSLNTNNLANASHTLTARAVDSHRNTGTTSVTVTVNNTPPVIAISSPQTGALIVGTFTVSGTASSQAGVASVQVRVDSGGWTSSPNTINWAVSINSAAYSDGAHTVSAMATDSVGHASTTSVSVTFSNSPPGVSISSPSPGALVTGVVAVSGSASSIAGIASVTVRVDSNAAVTASGTTSWSRSVDTTALNDGSHTITATATDSVGRSSSASVSVTVSNAPPSVSISSPQAGATISSTVTVSGFASSPAGIASVQVRVDSNAAVTASGTNGWSTTLDTTTLSQGAHTITATATDSLGRSSSASISVTVSNIIQTHQSPWYLQDSTGNVSTVNETMMWDGDANQSSPLPTGTITFSVNSTIQPNDANAADTCSQDPSTGYWSCVHTITSADLQWAPLAGGWSLHYAFNLQVEYPPTSTFTISYSGDANFAPSSAIAVNT
jgi:large repetitive protein